MNYFVNVFENKIHIRIDSNPDTGKEAVDPQEAAVLEPKEVIMTLEEVQALSDFQIKSPGQIPDTYELENIRIKQIGKKLLLITFMYTNDHQDIELMYKPITNGYAEEIEVNINQGEVEKIKHNSIEYTIITYNNELSEIIWNISDVQYTIRGKEKKQVLLDMAFSIQ